MITSRRKSILSEPVGSEPVAVGALAYFAERLRNRIYEIVIDEFEASGISKATLARRLRKDPSQLTRWLGSPGNWEIDSVSNVLFAISGGELNFSVGHPLRDAKKNFRQPEWLTHMAPEVMQRSMSGTTVAEIQVTKG